MKDKWEEVLECAIECARCGKPMGYESQRILSVYDHQPICMDCKQQEEKRPDYEEVSRNMIGQCMVDTELQMSDPGGYCYHHFYPFKC
jgi:hypothetical protein